MDSGDGVFGPINLGNPEEFTIRQLAELVIALTNSRSKIVNRPMPQDDPRQRKPDISRAQNVLNWAPRTPLREGLKRTISYFDRMLSEQNVESRLTTAVA